MDGRRKSETCLQKKFSKYWVIASILDFSLKKSKQAILSMFFAGSSIFVDLLHEATAFRI